MASALARRSSGAMVRGFVVITPGPGREARSGLRWRRRSPSVTMPASVPSSRDDDDAAEALGADLEDGRVHARADRHQRQALAGMHHLAHELQLGAELAARVEDPEMLGREAAPLEQRHRQRVADHELHGGRGGRREAVRACLERFGQGQAGIGLPGERARLIAGDGDQAEAEALGVGDEVGEFRRLARPRQGDDHVVRLDHAEVAVARLAGMDVIGGRARRREGGRDLAADMAGLAHAGDDHPPLGRGEEVDRRREGGAEGAAKPVHEDGDAVPLRA